MNITGVASRLRLFRQCASLLERNISSSNRATACQELSVNDSSKNKFRIPSTQVFTQPNKQMIEQQILCSRKRTQLRTTITQSRGYSTDGTEYTEKRPRTEVSYEELMELIKKDEILLIDVREPKEIEQTGVMPGAINIPITKLKTSLNLDAEAFAEAFSVPKPTGQGANLIFYGLSNVKAEAASELANKAGFKKARHYPGGWREYAEMTGQ